MAIYGFGAMFGGDTDVSDEFLSQEMACVGWSEKVAPPLYQMLRNIQNGDLVFIKTFNPQKGLTIKAVGVVTDRTIQRFSVLERRCPGVSVQWVWQDVEPVGVIDDKYTVRACTLFQELNPEVQARVIELLLSALPGKTARRKRGSRA